MNTQRVLAIPGKMFHRCKRVAVEMAKHWRGQERGPLFLFGGRTQHWVGMGSGLYAKEAVFKTSIDQCDSYIRGFGFDTVLPGFAGRAGTGFFDDEANVVFSIVCLQIGLSDLLRSRGVLPAATLGISLGEPAAVYAAGGVSMKDAISLACSTAMLSRIEKKEFVSVHVQAELQEARMLSEQCPWFFIPVFEMDQRGVSFFCYQQELELVLDYLAQKHYQATVAHKDPVLPFHTQLLIPSAKKWMAFIHPVQPRPLDCDYYSCVTGTCFPKHSIISNELWYQLKINPVLAHTALQSVKKQAYKHLLHIGPHRFLKGKIDPDEKIQVLDTIITGEEETRVLDAVVTRLRRISKTRRGPLSNEERFRQFTGQLNLSRDDIRQDPYPSLRYLKAQGPLHYLPVHNEWVVLEGELFEYILKHPELFSSKVLQNYDAYLLGADPPDHTLVRSLLQPLFSQQHFNRLADFTTIKAHELIDGLEQKRRVNVVDEFSIPLARSVAAKFLGLNETEAHSLAAAVPGHVYSLEFLEPLKTFCEKYLSGKRSGDENNIASFLLQAVEEGKIPFEAAVSLMRILWVAGMTTTSMLISTAVGFLAKDPDMADQLRQDETLIGKFIEECLRLEPPEIELRRVTTQEVVLDGQTLPAGSMIVLLVNMANRDEKYFEHPDEFRLDRQIKRHFSFGGGYHYCLGAGLARLEAKHAIKVLLEKWPGFKTGEQDAVRYYPSSHFRALSQLNICIEPVKTNAM